MGYKSSPFKMAPKSPMLKALKGSPAKSPAKQTTVGGKSLKEVNSTADVPKSTSFGGTNYKLGAQTGSGPHYFNEGYSSKHEKQGTIKRSGDAGVYHVSRETEKPTNIKKKPIPSLVESPAKKSGPGIGTPKSERLMAKADRLDARARKNTTPTAEYDPAEGKVMHGNKYTKKGMRLSKRADKTQFHAMGMSRSEARKATNAMHGK
jgi:hypothetical protein